MLKQVSLAAAALALTLPLPLGAAKADMVSTKVCVTDGDTIMLDGKRAMRRCIGGTTVQLIGIDAPELDQTCHDTRAQPWRCGLAAAAFLLEQLRNHEITCVGNSKDAEGNLLAVCSVTGVDVNELMVKSGLAVADLTFTNAYADEQDAARDARRGMWMGLFDMPAVWRKQHPESK